MFCSSDITRSEMEENRFGTTLKKSRLERGLSQQQLADALYVDRSTVASWETGRRVPSAVLVARISTYLNVDIGVLLGTELPKDEKPVIIMVDDEKLMLRGNIPVLAKVIPDAQIIGFNKPSEAVAFVKENHVSIAFLDIEMGRQSGLDLCREMLRSDPLINVVFLTAYMEYSYEAWNTGACGFLMKPLTEESVRTVLKRLRHPLK